MGYMKSLNLINDLRCGMRMMRRDPAITAIVVMTLAIGIGANSAIFSFVDAILLRPLPVVHPEELVKVNAGHRERFNNSSSYSDYQDFQSQSRTLTALAAYGYRGASIAIDGAPILSSVCVVSPNYFSLLGVNAHLGKTLGVETGDADHPLTAVISYRFWQRRFGNDAGAAGKVVQLNKQPCTIVGVMPRTFRGLSMDESPDLWIPMPVWTRITGEEQTDRESRWLELVGRLRPGVPLEKAQAELQTLGQQLTMAFPKTNKETRTSVIPESESRSPWARTMGKILLVIAGLVLLVACVNISNLLLVRSEGRQREIVMRMALGAGPIRLTRQLLTESVLLAVLGAAVALLLAGWIIRLLPGLLPSTLLGFDLDVRLDGRVLGFTFLISLLSVFGFGLVPAIHAARLDLNSILKQASRAATRAFRGGTLGNMLVVLQLALSIMLLVGAGLLTRTFWNISRLNPGFQIENRLLCWMVPAALGYRGAQLQSFYSSLLERIQALPGVMEATLVQRPPLYPAEGGQRYRVRIPEYPLPPDAEPLMIKYTMVWPNYFKVMGIRIMQGRPFSGVESGTGQGSILVNETMARQFWPNENPVGKHLEVLNKECEIIGVVQDGKYVALREAPEPYMYLAIPQFPSADMALLAHTAVDPQSLATSVERELRSLAKDLPAPEISTLQDQIKLAYQDERLAAVLVGCLSVLAAFLAAVGLYGLISFSVKQRHQEIGIRMALGAPPRGVLRMVLRQSLSLILAGAGLGLIAAFFLSHFLSSQLFGISAADPATYAAVSLLLAAVALLACYLPARRAGRVDPMLALRCE
jgi:predicted permease